MPCGAGCDGICADGWNAATARHRKIEFIVRLQSPDAGEQAVDCSLTRARIEHACRNEWCKPGCERKPAADIGDEVRTAGRIEQSNLASDAYLGDDQIRHCLAGDKVEI